MSNQPTVIQSQTPSEQDKLREAIRVKIVKRTFLQMHIFIYIVVNIILYLINTIFMHTDILWYPWPLISWGLAVGIHTFTYYAKSAGLLSYHMFLYVIINAFLVFVDWFPDGHITWVGWPIFGWGIGVLIHIIVYVMFGPAKSEDASKSWMDRKIDLELKGIKTQPTGSSSTVKEIICANCHTSNLMDAKFCGKCGQTLSKIV